METNAHFKVCFVGDSTHGIGSSLYGVDKKPSILICSHNSPLESKGPVPSIGKTKIGGDQSSKLEGFVSSSSWNMDTCNMLYACK